MSVLQVALAREAIQRVRVDLIAVGFFQDERPLRGGAGRVDWRLCGALSRLIRAGRIEGASGEALLIPARAGLRAPLVLALGLGAVARFGPQAFREAVGDVLTRAAALRVRSLALPLPFAGDPKEGDGLGLEALLEVASSARQADGASSETALLALVCDSKRRPALLRGLQERAATPPPGLQIQLPEEVQRVAPAGRRQLRVGS